MSRNKFAFLAAMAGGLSLMGASHGASAATLLGSDLETFAVLGASEVTNVPTSTIYGNVGVATGTAITGFTSVANDTSTDSQVTNGLVHSNTALAQSAQNQLTTAKSSLSSLGVGTLLPADLVGLTLAPGVYTVPAGTTNLSGTLTLDGGGNLNAAWVFQLPSTLITSANSVVNMINTGAGAGLFWNVGSSATINGGTTFLGNILAQASVTVNTSASILCGRALADTAAVTLQMNSIFAGDCQGDLAGSSGLSGGFNVAGDGTVSLVPIPATLPLFLTGLLGMGLLARRRRQMAEA